MENSRNVDSRNHFESETDFESSVNQCLESIRQWIENEKRLYGRTDNAFLMKFLRHSKYDVEKAKQKILRYYANRKKHPKWYNNRDPADEKIQRILDLESFIEMDQTDGDGNVICIVRASGKFNPPLFDIDVLTKVQLMLGDLYFTGDPKYSRNGVVVIGDMRDITATSVAHYTPSYIMNFLECHVMSFPIEIMAIHWVNAPAIFNALLSFAKIFMPEKLKKCTYTHGNDFKSLHKHVPAKYLPGEYGGTAGTLAVDYAGKMKNKFMQHRKYFLDDEKYGLLDEKEIKNSSKSNSGGRGGSPARPKMLEID